MVAEIQRENGNGYRRPSTVDFNLGRRGGYSADIFYGTFYRERKDFLAETAVDLVIKAGLFSPSAAREMVMRGMDSNVGQNPSMILFRKKSDGDFHKYIGFSWQEILLIPTEVAGNVSLLYLRLRAFEERHRRKHLGGSALQLSEAIYQEPSWFAHRTQSPAAAYSVLGSGVLIPGRCFPWNASYSENLLAEQLKDGVFNLVKVNGREIDQYGVSKGDYLESNNAFELDLTHAPTVELRRRMIEEFGMVFERGDSLVVVGQLR